MRTWKFSQSAFAGRDGVIDRSCQSISCASPAPTCGNVLDPGKTFAPGEHFQGGERAQFAKSARPFGPCSIANPLGARFDG
jgi:hypothetical protein